METRIYLMDCTPLAEDGLFDRALALVPAPRREKVLSFRHREDRDLSLGAGLLLCRAMAESGVAGEVLPGDNGKPFVAGRPDVYISLSHAGDYAMAALSGRPIGVDVQDHREYRCAIVRRFFHPEEQDWFSTLSEEEKPAAFYRMWSRKESYIKLHGRAELACFSCFAPEPGRRWLEFPFPGYACAVYLEDPADTAPQRLRCSQVVDGLERLQGPGIQA